MANLVDCMIDKFTQARAALKLYCTKVARGELVGLQFNKFNRSLNCPTAQLVINQAISLLNYSIGLINGERKVNHLLHRDSKSRDSKSHGQRCAYGYLPDGSHLGDVSLGPCLEVIVKSITINIEKLYVDTVKPPPPPRKAGYVDWWWSTKINAYLS